MTRPTLASHETRLALLEQASAHSAVHDEGVLATLKEIRDEIHSLRGEMKTEVKALTEKHDALELKWAEAKGTVRGIKLGWAAAFTFLGAAISLGVSNIVELFK